MMMMVMMKWWGGDEDGIPEWIQHGIDKCRILLRSNNHRGRRSRLENIYLNMFGIFCTLEIFMKAKEWWITRPWKSNHNITNMWEIECQVERANCNFIERKFCTNIWEKNLTNIWEKNLTNICALIDVGTRTVVCIQSEANLKKEPFFKTVNLTYVRVWIWRSQVIIQTDTLYFPLPPIFSPLSPAPPTPPPPFLPPLPQ